MKFLSVVFIFMCLTSASIANSNNSIYDFIRSNRTSNLIPLPGSDPTCQEWTPTCGNNRVRHCTMRPRTNICQIFGCYNNWAKYNCFKTLEGKGNETFNLLGTYLDSSPQTPNCTGLILEQEGACSV